MRRGLLCLAAVVPVLVGLVAGCARTEPPEPRTLVLSYGRLTAEHGPALRALADEFEKENPQFKVVLHALEPATDAQRHFYHRSFTAHSAFIDVFEMDTIWTAELAAAGVLDSPEELADDLGGRTQPGALAGARYAGKVMAVPAFPAVSVLYYRKDLLDKHDAVPPTTWDELADLSAKIGEAEGIAGFVWQGDEYEGLVCNFLEYYRSHGGTIELLEQGVRIDATVVGPALETMKGLITKGTSPDSVTEYRERQSRAVFLDGNALFTRDWDDLSAFINGPESEVAGKVGIAALPGTSLHRGVPTLGGWHLAVNKRSQNRAAAWKLVEFLTRAENQAKLARKLGRLPADLSVAVPGREGLVGLDAVGQAMAASQPRPASPYYHELSRLLRREIHAALTADKEVAEATAAIVEGARAITLPEEAGPEFPRALLNPSTVF